MSGNAPSLNAPQRHLKRLSQVYVEAEVYFITTCTFDRRPILNNRTCFDIIASEFSESLSRHQWHVGKFVIMPDHLHFVCAPGRSTNRYLSSYVAAFKEWSAKRICRSLQIHPPLWQKEFFDHLLRSDESYTDKWHYMRQNPVRAGLVERADDYPWMGEIESLSL